MISSPAFSSTAYEAAPNSRVPLALSVDDKSQIINSSVCILGKQYCHHITLLAVDSQLNRIKSKNINRITLPVYCMQTALPLQYDHNPEICNGEVADLLSK